MNTVSLVGNTHLSSSLSLFSHKLVTRLNSEDSLTRYFHSVNNNFKPKLAERGGFEPPIPCGIHAFEARAFDHSAISPKLFCIPSRANARISPPTLCGGDHSAISPKF